MGTLQAFDQSSLTSFSLLYWDIPFDWRYVTVFHIIKIPFDFTSSFSYHPLFFCSFLRHWSSKELSLFAILNYFLLPWTHSLTTTTIIRTPPNVFLIFWPVNFFFFGIIKSNSPLLVLNFYNLLAAFHISVYFLLFEIIS